ncbi:MAG TPA: methyltransferase domain-containing protein [Flavobacteriales bacterium]|nr:methyltransferase domain-containing protein [Flavobacteriales bacterium]HNU56535.1 methyltransferase domain-containing protein [Flavobacteriales bacterium]
MSKTTYDRIGTGYDATRAADPFLAQRLFDLLNAAPGKSIIDIGCGTGNYTGFLAARGLELTGLDPSERMLEQARTKSDAIRWVQGHAEAMPFEDRAFQAAVATLTLHHWADLERGLAECGRILQPGARFVVFTSTPEQTGAYWLRHYFPRMIERSAATLPAEERIIAGAARSRLELKERVPSSVRPDLQDLFLFARKHQPFAYLDPEFRKGISSFALLAAGDELDEGLASLEADIASGQWAKVRDEHEHQGGDYLHLVFERA